MKKIKSVATKAKSSGKMSYEQKMMVIASKIRRGDQSRICAKTGYASSTVSEVLSGKYNNMTIVNYAFKMTNPRKAVTA
ncbi:MAG: hypothetical protein NTY95_17460 [Bacteroidia bacterium]|jgi:hypothetical protein|nr:hypothetical protein [Bacteroidia bacterium]